MRVQRLPRGLVERVHPAGHEPDRDDVPHPDRIGQRQKSEQEDQRRYDDLREEDQPALVELVCEYPADEVERDCRRCVRQSDVPQVQRRAGKLVCHPTLGEDRHLEPAYRCQRAKPVGPVLRVSERGRKREEAAPPACDLVVQMERLRRLP